MERLSWEVSSAETMRHGDISVTPESRALVLRCPWGGLVWSRPSALRVEQNGETREIPLVDVTRQAQIAAATAGLVIGLVVLILNIIRKGADDD